jgi:hypothetical protein
MNPLSVVAVLGLGILLGGEPPSVSKTVPAKEAFERFRSLDGVWRGESTRGWKEDVSFKTIAAGSAVIETSFDAHPNETMFRLDGEVLDLTHYCVARNQPHLKATSFDEDGRRVTFTFVDGGNLLSRDKGHMDKAVGVEELPDGFRAVLVLHDVEGFTHEEIGRLLGIEAGTSKSQLARAREALRRRLGGRVA